MPEYIVTLTDDQAAAVEAALAPKTAEEWAQECLSAHANGIVDAEKRKALAAVGLSSLSDLMPAELQPIVTARAELIAEAKAAMAALEEPVAPEPTPEPTPEPWG